MPEIEAVLDYIARRYPNGDFETWDASDKAMFYRAMDAQFKLDFDLERRKAAIA